MKTKNENATQFPRKNEYAELYALIFEVVEKEMEVANLKKRLEDAESEISSLTYDKDFLLSLFNVEKRMIKPRGRNHYVLKGDKCKCKYCEDCWEESRIFSLLTYYKEDEEYGYPYTCHNCGTSFSK